MNSWPQTQVFYPFYPNFAAEPTISQPSEFSFVRECVWVWEMQTFIDTHICRDPLLTVNMQEKSPSIWEPRFSSSSLIFMPFEGAGRTFSQTQIAVTLEM